MKQIRVALLGTGKMGSAIATRLAHEGFEVVLWNRTRSRAEALGLGTVVNTPAAAVKAADVIVSSLTGPEAVLATYLGPDGALSVARGKTFIEMSTAGPDLVAELEQHVAEAGGRIVEAPIMGAPPLMSAGQATILVGGTDADVAMAEPVLSAFGTVRHVGGTGSAARLKLVANSMLADIMLAAAELQVAGEMAGLNPDDIFWVLQREVPGLESRRAGLVENRHTPAQFALRDLHKDVALALTLFGRSGATTPMLLLAGGQVDSAAAATPDLDISAVKQLYQR